tara:strand:+ start:170741 stop:171442 length:702 start_codon:yes stop_codon:yes gene_type:complete
MNKILLSIAFILMLPGVSFAQMSLGGQLTLASSGQTDYDNLIQSARSDNSASTSELGSMLEISGTWAYRFNGSIVSMMFRPSYFTVGSDGNGTPGSYDYSISGFTLFGITRFTALENNYFKFFLQTGIGWGFVNGSIKEGSVDVDFAGNNVGFLGGIGAEFCFGGSAHCMAIEGNIRYLPVNRNIVESVSGTCPSSDTGLSQCTDSRELELNDRDLAVSLSGILGTIGYTYYF